MRPDQFSDILGTTFVQHSHDVVLQLGTRRYDRFRLGEIGVPQIKAARTLHLVLQRLSVTTPAGLLAHLPDLTALRGVGHAAFYAALAVLADVEQEAAARARYHSTATRADGHQVTFSTLKAHARRRRKQHRVQTNPRTRRAR